MHRHDTWLSPQGPVARIPDLQENLLHPDLGGVMGGVVSMSLGDVHVVAIAMTTTRYRAVVTVDGEEVVHEAIYRYDNSPRNPEAEAVCSCGFATGWHRLERRSRLRHHFLDLGVEPIISREEPASLVPKPRIGD